MQDTNTLNEAVCKAVSILRNSKNLEDDRVYSALIDEGIAPHLAARLIEFLPIAYCRLILSNSGARFADSFRRRSSDGNIREQFLSLEPVWRAAEAYAREEAARGVTPQDLLDFRDVVSSPTDYDGKTLFIEATLEPSFHSLSLYDVACGSKEGSDVTTEAILPDGWESLPIGKKLRGIIRHGRPAKVQLVGTFKSSVTRGRDGQRFRFSISQINSVSKEKPGDRRGVF
jgi:hypothetical protein